MVTDEERREVARNLREDAANDELRKHLFVDEIIVGCIDETMYDEWGNVREVEILNKLADLIDRTTCKIKQDVPAIWGICSNCGAAVNTVRAVGDATKYLPTRYCPNCGAEVVRTSD